MTVDDMIFLFGCGMFDLADRMERARERHDELRRSRETMREYYGE